ncbi:hypothetical protein AK812_SmicGene47070 [Symbiodinium microadriaticum]|uniref:Uncharacterized protein n=1 Tax=Symbiodinium microadriaticum TaxID=2951 RepID=A0A1Q9BSH3_SYMMI|nr:hypothetical protein AK812_SmicGene47070 [Symbiodinium microadriaticum]
MGSCKLRAGALRTFKILAVAVPPPSLQKVRQAGFLEWKFPEVGGYVGRLAADATEDARAASEKLGLRLEHP